MQKTLRLGFATNCDLIFTSRLVYGKATIKHANKDKKEY